MRKHGSYLHFPHSAEDAEMKIRVQSFFIIRDLHNKSVLFTGSVRCLSRPRGKGRRDPPI
jgi:hypothetical protein